jgi:hypothetical protein
MLGVTALTLFEWWTLRRRFVALSELSMSLSRLDIRYKEMLGKAELRMQQLYGRRRASAQESPHGARSVDEVELERLSHDLKDVLQEHLERLGMQREVPRLRAALNQVLGREEEPAPQPTRR